MAIDYPLTASERIKPYPELVRWLGDEGIPLDAVEELVIDGAPGRPWVSIRLVVIGVIEGVTTEPARVELPTYQVDTHEYDVLRTTS